MQLAPVPSANARPYGYIIFPVDRCAGCHKLTTELYSRTIDGARYCTTCLERGAGVQDLYNAGLDAFVSKQLAQLAEDNGFLIKPPNTM